MNCQRLYENEDLENKIYDIVLENNDYADALRNNNHYDFHYFLSPFRHDLFIWYPFKKEGSLLEIGAGYGQLTSLFTQRVNRVVAIEDRQSNAISSQKELKMQLFCFLILMILN